ncbi:MAG: molybdate ABC transporter substrate-binding protein [Selenomonadaceae bacterium]|nr:molybdate ABC transporter substrate-binding protein [Selenomonadaceae bacterium]
MLSLILTGCGEEKISNELHISAAASLTDAMKEISAEFEKENPDIKIIFNVGSSGALQQAIENGGETDLFFSAAQKQMDALEKSNNLVEGTRKNLLENEVVLIVPTDSDKNISSFTDLTQENINRIALGEFKGVPVGQYSEEILNNLGILDTIKSKIVFGSDVRQVLSWVETGDADCGIVYATDAAISDKVKVVAVAEKNLHKPVIYPAAIIKTSKNLDAAKKFLNFVETEPAKNIFSKFGFKVIN